MISQKIVLQLEILLKLLKKGSELGDLMIDIIVPIYSGYDETKECIESLINTNNKLEHRIVLINDCSPDKNINNMLGNFIDKKLVVLNNNENIGFVKSVNKGIRFSNNDVILLNSDTIVTDHWIEKLYNAAYSKSNVGTVTALTNNGTLASVPKYNRDNELPSGFTVQQFSDLVEKVSQRAYPVIPTAVGHAMYIKRILIKKVGILDEDSFGMGYGEEIDFSCRAVKKGYKNILADDTFIYHVGGTSFKEKKMKLIAVNKKKLYEKHWWYPFKVKCFLLINRKVKKVCKSIRSEIRGFNK